MSVKNYRDLEVWQLSMDLAEHCYRLTKRFPRAELFGLAGQIRRAAGSVPANLAEGHGRQHTKEFINHISIARGSLKELETHLMLAHRVELLDEEALQELMARTDRISRMLAGLRASLQSRLRGRGRET